MQQQRFDYLDYLHIKYNTLGFLGLSMLLLLFDALAFMVVMFSGTDAIVEMLYLIHLFCEQIVQ